MITILYVYENENKKYFHLDNKWRHDTPYRTLYYATQVIEFVDGICTNVLKDRYWTHDKNIDTGMNIDDYIKKYNLRCGYWNDGKLVYKGTECTNPYNVFQDIKMIFMEDSDVQTNG